MTHSLSSLSLFLHLFYPAHEASQQQQLDKESTFIYHYYCARFVIFRPCLAECLDCEFKICFNPFPMSIVYFLNHLDHHRLG